MYQSNQIRNENLAASLRLAQNRPAGLMLVLKGEARELTYRETKAREAKLAAIREVYGE